MYSGITLTNRSGNILGGHQKINRVAHRHLKDLDPGAIFPSIRSILHFEGKNGPDGIKSKSPSKDEPWHFYDPFDPDDTELIEHIEAHYAHLVEHLRASNFERASFEASWLAHAIVDGLTPAHHYPYEAEMEKIRGESKDSRNSIKSKLIMPGATKFEMVANNWKVWGAKGLLLTHGMFELGVAMIIKPLRLGRSLPTSYDLKTLEHIGITEVFKRAAREIALLNIYERYYQWGWSPKLANDIKKHLAPTMAKVVTLAWLSAAKEAANN